ncbi:MAG: HSP20 family [Planctomycetota bacterium]|nr:MAG: HSP20 family [Planctomycetota bacterium]
MNLAKWEPFKELESVSDRLSRLFSRTRTNGDEAVQLADWSPTTDVTETNEEYLIKAELPEVKREDVKISIEEGVLTFQGERKQEKEEKGKKFHRIERSYGSFLRSFTLPTEVDASKIRAEFKDGLLNLHLPKSEKAKTKVIDVKVS